MASRETSSPPTSSENEEGDVRTFVEKGVRGEEVILKADAEFLAKQASLATKSESPPLELPNSDVQLVPLVGPNTDFAASSKVNVPKSAVSPGPQALARGARFFASSPVAYLKRKPVPNKEG